MMIRKLIAKLFASFTSLSSADEFWRAGNFDDIETAARKDRYVRTTTLSDLNAPLFDNIFPASFIVEPKIVGNWNVGSLSTSPDGSVKMDMSAGVITINLGVSTRARKLLRRLRAGHWYPVLNKRTPKAMQELIDAKLVSQAERPERFVNCYVPTEYIPAEHEIFPEQN